jgi:hypothetical protein
MLVQFAFPLRLFATFAAFAVKIRQDRKGREVKTQSYAKNALSNSKCTSTCERPPWKNRLPAAMMRSGIPKSVRCHIVPLGLSRDKLSQAKPKLKPNQSVLRNSTRNARFDFLFVRSK